MITFIIYFIIGYSIGHLLFKIAKLNNELHDKGMIQDNLKSEVIYLENRLDEQVSLNKSLQKQLDKFKRGY